MGEDWWDKVLPAAAALVGVVAASGIEWIRSWSTRRYERKNLLLAKLEQLTEAMSETVEWTDALLRSSSFEQLRALNVPIAPRKVFALTMVYFPTLQPAAIRLQQASSAFSDFFIELPRGEYRDTIGVFAQRNDPRGFAEVVRGFAEARQALDEAILAFAAKHIGL